MVVVTQRGFLRNVNIFSGVEGASSFRESMNTNAVRSSPPLSKRTARKARPRDSIPRKALGKELQRQIRRFGLSRDVAAFVVGDAASQLSRLMNGHFNEFSADRLARMLLRMGANITIRIEPARALGRRGLVRVRVL
jgi:predicted XRE-type DNA-binding protein